MFLILFPLIFSFKCNADTYVFEIVIHADPEAIMSLNSAIAKELYSETQPNITIKVFIGAIFDRINRNLKKNNIQIKANFNRLNFGYYKPSYNVDICGNSVAVERSSEILGYIRKREKNDDIGNRLIINFCQNMIYNNSSSHVLSVDTCGHISTVIFGEVRSMMDEIESVVYKMLGNIPNYLNENGINNSLLSNICSYGMRCLNNISKNSIGQILAGTQTIEHNPSESKYLNLEAQVFEQDIFLGRQQPLKDRYVNVFAEMDYSNDSELYEDIEKSKNK
ncbi:hypothetical protein SLOPH_628 [Spraguea lophii 42_110]|uniref:Spore wall protein n=1 Tax=Spraguea lophii (strain 42_110) TaxID=1358809 RepID=S7WDC8_SPRLO|nr:hypothetical protein SLOPH_628 [Spraguea lophii 42_110]